ncbi:hypothetical protein AB0C87_24830 [Actinomadura sp. NPDC048021]|uniref:hypothetical protein n=1 Tax=Actinomadura sp. NPDC048021 TaxID=3155385 RepID=UPI0033E55621
MIGTKFQWRVLPLECIRCRYFNSIGNNGHVVCKRCWKWSNHNMTYKEARYWKRWHVCKREDIE